MFIYAPFFKAEKDQTGLERLTTGCGALPYLPREDLLDETVVLYHQVQIFCDVVVVLTLVLVLEI